MRNLIAFALLLGALPASAGTISIVLTQAGELRGTDLAVQLSVANEGDEPARGVVPTLSFAGREARGEARDLLVPGFPFETTVSIPADAPGPGRWPYRLVIDYTDANEYPFQALQVATLEIGDPPPVKLAATRFEGARLSESADVELRVKNLSGQARRVKLGVAAPDALEVTAADGELELGPWEEKAASFELVNRTALAASRLPVFVTLEYDEGDVHQALVAQSTVEILAAGPAGGLRSARSLAVGLAVLGALAVGWLVLRRRAR